MFGNHDFVTKKTMQFLLALDWILAKVPAGLFWDFLVIFYPKKIFVGWSQLGLFWGHWNLLRQLFWDFLGTCPRKVPAGTGK
jgi:hypothetical protein